MDTLAKNEGMRIGGPCFVLILEPQQDARKVWKGCGQFDWLVDDASMHPQEVRAVEELGELRLHGIQCTAYLCDDGRARALPMVKNNRGEKR